MDNVVRLFKPFKLNRKTSKKWVVLPDFLALYYSPLSNCRGVYSLFWTKALLIVDSTPLIFPNYATGKYF